MIMILFYIISLIVILFLCCYLFIPFLAYFVIYPTILVYFPLKYLFNKIWNKMEIDTAAVKINWLRKSLIWIENKISLKNNKFIGYVLNTPLFIYMTILLIATFISPIPASIIYNIFHIKINGDLLVFVTAEFLILLNYLEIILLSSINVDISNSKKIDFNQNQALKDLELHESFLKSIIKPLSLLSFLSALVGMGNVLFPEIKYEILKIFQENSNEHITWHFGLPSLQCSS